MALEHSNSQILASPIETEPNLSIAQELGKSVNRTQVELAIMMLLDAIGEDVQREGLRETPQRVARFYEDFIAHESSAALSTLFETQAYGQLIVVKGIRVSSLCEHHLLPFSCSVAVAYYPAKQILGLSKFARVAHAAARRLNTQERLTRIIRDTLLEITGSHSLLVMTSDSEHHCMTMRGVEEPHAKTTILDVAGLFKRDSERDFAIRMIRAAE